MTETEDQQEYEKLKRKRASCKSKITIFNKFVTNLESKYNNKIITDGAVYFELQERLEKFARVLDEFDDIQLEIEQFAFVEVANEVPIRESFNTEYFTCLGKGKEFISVSSEADGSNGSDGARSEYGRSIRSDLQSTKSGARGREPPKVPATVPDVQNGLTFREIRLPEINLKFFDGCLDSWPEFRDTFESLINQRTTITDIEKFHHLRSNIAQSVFEHIGSLDYTSDNYKHAWAAICKRYNNSTDLTQHHLEKLFNLEKIEVATSSGIRKILDSTSNRLKALSTLGEQTEHWDSFVIFLMLSKLDDDTCAKWQEIKLKYKRPTFANFSEYLDRRAGLLSSIERNKAAKAAVSSVTNKKLDLKPKHEIKSNKVKSLVTSNGNSNTVFNFNCSFCKNQHSINDCPEFNKLNVNERLERVKQKGLCINCLRVGHIIRQCRSGPCRRCKGRHHTLLHIDRALAMSLEASSSQHGNNHVETVTMSSHLSSPSQVILSTVLVHVRDKNNTLHNARALLDVGSQSSFISSDLCERLNLEKNNTAIVVSGLNDTCSQIKFRTNLNVQSIFNSFSFNMSCLVVPQITGNLPNYKIEIKNLQIPNNIQLADPNFNVPGKIDILIGADYFWEILCIGQIKLGSYGPLLQKTRFGWVVAGPLQASTSNTVHCNLSRNTEIEKQLERFWTIEEFPNTKAWSNEEELAESHFINTTRRDENGQFIVTIPLKDRPELLGDSREAAQKRFLNLERKFGKNPSFRENYHKFFNEYRELGHMVKIAKPDYAKPTYYMPHHGIIKDSSLTTKLRVVFDSSCPSSTGYSFNDLQLVGPTIQTDLFSILLLYRRHNFVIAGDIEKMYRMCKIEPAQRPLQRILWRDNPNAEIDTYELTTVTYGTSSAPFLAIRCLYQLGVECADEQVSEVIKHHFYVDDMLTGGPTVEETALIVNEVVRILDSGGFRLRKFVSNSSEVLRLINSSNDTQFMDLGVNENAKTLGIVWNAVTDCFLYKISIEPSNKVTKRTVLSEMSQIFDPLGFLSPSIILAKLILRDIWVEKLDWDESLPSSLHTRWIRFRDGLKSFNELAIPRQVICSNAISIEIHGFSDASTLAYGACVYIKTQNSDDETFIHLVCCKSKVSPLKAQTVPRLELIAALLMCRLVDKVISSLKLQINRVTYWTDSTIVLGWINTPVNLLQVFVANRVAAIQELTSVENWRHVPTNENPADCVSRGVPPISLKATDMYWSGPPWLKRSYQSWPAMPEKQTTLPEIKRVIAVHKATIQPLDILENFSDLTKTRRIVAYCLRFKTNSLKVAGERNLGPLTNEEIKGANLCLVKITQGLYFEREITQLRDKKPLDRQSKILKLNPFLDSSGILRVGGRLTNSNLPICQKHPILLDSKSRFTRNLFLLEHKRLLHAGPQLLLANIRYEYWPLNGRNLARKVVRECVTCFRTKPSIVTPLMGNLPDTRVNPSPPFFVSGVDYAGPFKVKDRQGRGCQVTKAYICIFVCFTTHAVHIELVPNLSTESFIAAFRRFIARRGKPSRVYSDNGTNFIGAYNELNDLGVFLKNNGNNLTETIENEGIAWSFIPAYAPHFGGLWEASVKSMKHHLVRIAGNALLTFEQLYTLLVQIEAILNSRPMYPLSSDPSDLTPLTPSHFVIGRPLTSIADSSLLTIPENRLKHYERIQQLQQHFWDRWSLEYVSGLQERTKWRTNQGTLQVNDLVIIKEADLPPFRWSLGRIVSLHPGKDGISRVATVRTQGGCLKRAFSKICPLPKADN